MVGVGVAVGAVIGAVMPTFLLRQYFNTVLFKSSRVASTGLALVMVMALVAREMRSSG